MRDIGFILKILIALPICAFLVVFAITNEVPDALLCALGTASLCVVALPVLFTRPIDIFHPFALLIISVFLGTAGKAFYLVFSRSPRWFFLTDGMTAGSFLTGTLLILGGCICITIGYFAAGRFQFQLDSIGQLRKQLSSRKLVLLAMLTLPVAAVTTADFLNRTGFELNGLSGISKKRSIIVNEDAAFGQQTAALGYHRMIAGTLPAAACMALTIALCFQSESYSSRTTWCIAGACFCTACCLPFFTSSRKEIIFLLLDVLIVLNYSGRLRSSHLVIGFVAAATVGTLMLAIRVAEDSSFSDISSNMGARAADALFGTTNYLEITKTSAMHRSVPKVMDYKLGMTYPGVLYAPIPRTLYPEKPSVRPGPEFAQKVYGFHHGKGGAIPPGFIGETIWNFSAWCILPASLFYGAMLRVLYNSFVPYVQKSSTALLIYVVILLPVSFELLGGAVSGSMLNAAQRSIFALVFIVLASELPRQQRVYVLN